MFGTLRSQILIVMLSTITVSVLLVLYLSKNEILKAMISAEEASAKTVLDLAIITIENEYKGLNSYMQKTLENHKRELKNIVLLQESFILNYYEKVKKGLLSEKDAKETVLEELRAFSYGQNDYLWVSDYNSVLISHPSPELHKKDCSKLMDVKGKPIVPPMVEMAQKDGEGYYSYWWNRLGNKEHIEKLAYFKNFPAWKWVLITGVYIDDIEKENKKRQEDMIERLNQALSKIKIAKTGYLFIFDKSKHMVCHPNRKGEDGSLIRNPVTGANLLDEFIYVTDKNKNSFEYLWDKPQYLGDFRFKKIAFISQFKPLGWYVVSTVYKDEIEEPIYLITQKIAYLSLLIVFFVIILSFLFSSTLTNPLRRMVKRIKELSKLDLTGDFLLKSASKELDHLAKYFNGMIEEFRHVLLDVKKDSNQLHQESDVIVTIAEQLTNHAEQLSHQSVMLASSSEQMTSNMNSIASTSEKMSSNVNEVSETSKSMSSNMKSVALSIRNIAISMRNVGNSARGGSLISADAIKMAKKAGDAMQTLTTAASEIDEVTEVIKRIAERTHLLAVNATIEASRAGESGKGFGVVANEIKNFSSKTTSAAEDIAKRILSMQQRTLEAVNVINEVAEIINKINISSETIMTALDQQTNATNEATNNIMDIESSARTITASMEMLAQGSKDVSMNVAEAAVSYKDITENTFALSRSAEESNKVSHRIKQSAKELLGLAMHLRELVDKFKIEAHS